MNWKHLLGVLLTGGSLAAGCDGAARSSSLVVGDGAGSDVAADAREAESAIAAEVDVRLVEADARGDVPGGDVVPLDAGPGQDCLCSPTRCCDQHAGAPATVQMGFVCCWGTSC